MSKRIWLTTFVGLITSLLFLSHWYLEGAGTVERQLSFDATITPQFKPEYESQPAFEKPREVTDAAQTHRLFDLKHRTAAHSSPDALVYIPAGFDTSSPIRLIVFNHGLTNTVDDVLEIWQLDKHMHLAAPNSVLVIPEWALDPKAYSSKAGPFHNRGFFRNMLQEIMSKVPPLSVRTLDDIASIDIMAFSGGFRAARSEMMSNDLDDKIRSLALLDSLYEPDYFDEWLTKNAQALAHGDKVYYNFFFDTAGNTQKQIRTLERILKTQNLPRDFVYKDTENPESVLPLATIETHGIVYKWTTISTPNFISHQQVVNTYFPLVLKALTAREKKELLSV